MFLLMEPIFYKCVFSYLFQQYLFHFGLPIYGSSISGKKKQNCFILHYLNLRGAVMALVLVLISGISAEANLPTGPYIPFHNRFVL